MEESKKYALKRGTVLDDRYVIEEMIGEGGFGITYKDIHKSIGMPVAVKEFFSKTLLSRDVNETNRVSVSWDENQEKFEKEKKKFLREARIISDFSKEKGIVHIMDYFEANNTVYIVMEYIEGESLRDYIDKNGTMTVDEVIGKILPVINSLGKINDCGVIHRDIGPNNIMVQDDGEFRLIDFGSARDYEEMDEKSYSVVLTGGYAPPEQYDKDGRLGPWTDVYAVCAVIYFAITGHSPQEALSRMLYDEIEKPSERGVKINKETERIIMKGLSVNPKDRYQLMDELEADLRAQVAIKEKAKKSFLSKKAKIIGISVAAVVVLAVGGFFAWKQYYKTHREEIMFGDEPVQHIVLQAPKNMSVAEFDDAKKTVEEKLDVLTDGKYLLDVEKDKLRIAISSNIVGKEDLYHKEDTYLNFEDFLKQYICQANINGIGGVKLTDKDIEKISIKKGGKYIDKDETKTRKKIIKNVNKYYVIRLKKDYLDLLKKKRVKERTLIEYVTDDEGGKGYEDNAFIDYNSSSVYVQCDVKNEKINELYEYNLTHKPMKKSLTVKGFDYNIKWYGTEDFMLKGKNQVNEDQIQGESVTFLYGGYGEQITKGEYYSSVIDFTERLDAFDMKYAIGTDQNSDRTIAIKVDKKHVNTYLMKNIMSDNYKFNICSNYSETDVTGTEDISVGKTNGKTCLIVKYDEYDKKDLQETTSKIIKNGENKLYFTIGKDKLAAATITKPITDGKIVFDQSLLKDKSDKRMDDYCHLVIACLKQTKMSAYLTCYDTVWTDKDSKLTDRNNNEINDLQGIDDEYKYDKKTVESLFNNVKVQPIDKEDSLDEGYSLSIDIMLTDFNDKKVEESIASIGSIIKNSSILSGRYKYVYFKIKDDNEKFDDIDIQFNKSTVDMRFEKELDNYTDIPTKQIEKYVDKYLGNVKWDDYYKKAK